MPIEAKHAPGVTPPEIPGLVVSQEPSSGAPSGTSASGSPTGAGAGGPGAGGPGAGAGGGGPGVGGAGPAAAGGPPAGAGVGFGAASVASAPAVTPVTVQVSDMPPVIGAGVRLARLVLIIAAGSIVLLLLYLAWMDAHIAKDVASSYEQVLNPSKIGSEFYILGQLEKLVVDLKVVENDPSLQLDAEAAKNADDVEKILSALPSVTRTQKTQLQDCISAAKKSTPAGASSQTSQSRSERIGACLNILENIREAALEAATGATNAQVAGESASKVSEQRQNLHTFWIQAAQLILLNLLLPLLTALFGYVFGTQQGQRTP